MRSIVKRYLKACVENANVRHAKAVFGPEASNRVNDMQKTIKSIGAAAIRIMTAIALTGPAGSGAVELAGTRALALDPCPLLLPMEAHEAAALWAEGWQRDAIPTRSGLVLRARVSRSPEADTGFGCPIARTTA